MQKGMTPIIAIVILVMIAIASAGSSWVFFSGYLGSKLITLETPPGTTFCQGNKAQILIVNTGIEDVNVSTHNMTRGLFENHPNKIGSWEFEEWDSNVSLDSSGNNNHGSVVGDTLMLVHMDESGGLVAFDNSSFDNNCNLNGMDPAACWVDGKSGNSLDFDGLDDFIDCGSGFSLDISVGISVSAWIHKKAPAGNFIGLAGRYDGGLVGYGLNTDGANVIRFTVGDGGSISQALETAPTPMNTWVHYMGTFDGTTTRLYKNGALEDVGGAIGSPVNSGSSFKVGTSNFVPSQFFTGQIDEVAVYNHSLTPEEVKMVFEYGKAKLVESVHGRFGRAFEFDGLDDRVEIRGTSAGIFNFPEDGTYSLMAWVKPKGYTVNQAIISKGEHQYRLGTSPNYYYGFFEKQADGWWQELRYPATLNQWAHVIGIQDGNDQRLFINGRLVNDTSVWPVNWGTRDETRDVWIGKDSSDFRERFNGTIDSAMIFDTALTQAEIDADKRPACNCIGGYCSCGDIVIFKTSGDGYFFPYFNKATIGVRDSVIMTDHNCMSKRCTYRIVTPSMGYDAVVNCE